MTNLVAEGVVATFLYYFSKMVQVIIQMMNSYLEVEWNVLKEEQKDDFHHDDCQVLLFNRLFPE
jgi:hypothetical protein